MALTTLLTDVKTRIEATLVANGITGYEVTRGEMPNSPAKAITIQRYPGRAPMLHFGSPGLQYEHPMLTLTVRGETTDYDGPLAVINTIYRDLVTVQDELLTTSRFLMIKATQQPSLKARDGNQRSVWSCNFSVEMHFGDLERYAQLGVTFGDFTLSGLGTVLTPVDAHWDNLLAGWLMNETSDGTGYVNRVDVQSAYDLTDVEGGGNGGVGGCAHVAGTLGGNAAYSSSGGSDDARFLRQASGPSVSGLSDFFIAMWVKAGLHGRAMLTSAYTSPTETWTLVTDSTSSLQFRYNGQLAQTPMFSYSTGWNLVFAYFDSGDNKAHVQVNNGTIYDSPSTASVISGTHAETVFGADYYIDSGLHSFDEAYFFSAVKDATWRTAHYNAGSGRTWPA